MRRNDRHAALLLLASMVSCPVAAAYRLDDAPVWLLAAAYVPVMPAPMEMPSSASGRGAPDKALAAPQNTMAPPRGAMVPPERLFIAIFPEEGSEAAASPPSAWQDSAARDDVVAMPPLVTLFVDEALAADTPRPANLSAAENCCAATPLKAGRGAWTLSAGVRRDRLDFNIASETGSPNVLSELKWTLNMAEIHARGDWQADNGFVALADIGYAYAVSGNNRDSDYLGDGRTGEFSRAYAKTRGSMGSHVAFGVGWRLLPGSFIGVTPLVGYDWRQLEVRMRDGRQVISAYGWRNGEIGPFSGLDARYAPRWHGPWAGMRLDTLATEKWRAQIGIRRQWFDYRAEADWNLRADFQHPVSYTHEGKSRGWLGEASLIRRLSAHASLSLRLAYQKQALKNGKDTVFFSDGKQGSTRLNEVNWQSWSVLLGYRLDF